MMPNSITSILLDYHMKVALSVSYNYRQESERIYAEETKTRQVHPLQQKTAV